MARAEGEVERLESELAAVARAMESSDELRSTLTDPQLPLERKQGVLEELIGGRASRLTRSVLHLIVGLDRASELPQIVRSLMRRQLLRDPRPSPRSARRSRSTMRRSTASPQPLPRPPARTWR